MSSISKAGIFIDLKQLLPFTDQMNKAMSRADREDYGHRLIQMNLDMVSYFMLAYHRRDEKTEVVIEGREYVVSQKGEKRACIDKLEACFNAYQAIMDFCFENNKFSRFTKRKRQRKHKQYMLLMAKLGSGIVKWSASVYKQVSVSENDSGTS